MLLLKKKVFNCVKYQIQIGLHMLDDNTCDLRRKKFNSI